MSACPLLVDPIITSYEALIGNSTATAAGTVVGFSCGAGYATDQEIVLTCTNGNWVGTDGETYTSTDDLPACSEIIVGTTDSGLSNDDRIVIIVCSILVFLMLVAILAMCILYRNKKRETIFRTLLVNRNGSRPKERIIRRHPKGYGRRYGTWSGRTEDRSDVYSSTGSATLDGPVRYYPPVFYWQNNFPVGRSSATQLLTNSSNSRKINEAVNLRPYNYLYQYPTGYQWTDTGQLAPVESLKITRPQVYAEGQPNAWPLIMGH